MLHIFWPDNDQLKYSCTHFLFSRVTIIPAQEQQSQRPQQMFVKKISPNGRIVVVNQNIATSTQQITAINKVAPNIITTTANQRGGPRCDTIQFSFPNINITIPCVFCFNKKINALFCSGFIQVRQNLMANNSSCIDLTDEDDPKPQQRQQANPPALVALNARNRQQIVQTQPVQRQLVTTQQTIRNAAAAAQNRKLPVLGRFKEIFQ